LPKIELDVERYHSERQAGSRHKNHLLAMRNHGASPVTELREPSECTWIQTLVANQVPIVENFDAAAPTTIGGVDGGKKYYYEYY